MIVTTRLFTLCFCLFLFTVSLSAQERKVTLSGKITNLENGEGLIGVSVWIKGTQIGAVSDEEGLYSFAVAPGKHILTTSYIGYSSREIPLNLTSDTHIDILLTARTNQLKEVVVSAENRNANISKIEMGKERLSIKTIKAIPALMGEVDVIKAIQLLPGVQSAAEGTSGFSVRGGGHDQNLILLDETPVYSASHLMGFFSIFNNDAVKEATLYKGDIPASFGGRLASLLDVRTKEGNHKTFSGSGGIGLIASRITLEGPIVKEKLSFLISGRRTYADLFLKLAKDPSLRNTSLYFYDMNAKIDYRINERNRLFVTSYWGNDHLDHSLLGMDFGNKIIAMRWNHIFSPKFFSNISLSTNFYNYSMFMGLNELVNQNWETKINDYTLKADFTYQLHEKHIFKFGLNMIFHNFSPGKVESLAENPFVISQIIPREYALENAAYLSAESAIGDHLKLKYGLRYSLYQNISNGKEITILSDYEPAYRQKYSKGVFFHHQGHFEPRLGAVWMFDELRSLKASYARTTQYLQVASNSSAGSPLDVWFQASQNIRPQIADQIAGGYFRNFMDFEVSAEVYYKKMKDVIDFKDHAYLIANENLEQEVRVGKGYSYGLELMLRKNSGPLTGWVSYTLSKSRRLIEDINNNQWFRSPYDKPHNITIVGNYELNSKWVLAANWIYTSGTPATFPTGRYMIENEYVPIYSGRNEYRFPDYHRLDLSATYRFTKKRNNRLQHELNFSIYNAYGRKNAWSIRFRQDRTQPDVSYVEMMYLFSVVPSVTWNFYF